MEVPFKKIEPGKLFIKVEGGQFILCSRLKEPLLPFDILERYLAGEILKEELHKHAHNAVKRGATFRMEENELVYPAR